MKASCAHPRCRCCTRIVLARRYARCRHGDHRHADWREYLVPQKGRLNLNEIENIYTAMVLRMAGAPDKEALCSAAE
jgi:hypothetical protein